MKDSISDVRESLNDEVAKLREALRQAARCTDRIAALEARLIELELRVGESRRRVNRTAVGKSSISPGNVTDTSPANGVSKCKASSVGGMNALSM